MKRGTKAERRRHNLRMIAEELRPGAIRYKRAVFQHAVETRYDQVRLGSRLWDLLIERQLYRRFDGQFRRELVE
jgi:hypothetical protein